MNYVENMYMEDIHSATLAALDAITKDLEKSKVILTEKQQDEVYIAIDGALEKLSNGNYRHEH